jgi:ankyrin repeat protein
MLLNVPNIDLNIKDRHGATALIILAKNGNMKLVESLLVTGKINLDILDNYMAYYSLGNDARGKLFALIKKLT